MKKEHDDKDDGEAPNGDNGKGSGEDVNSGFVENCKDGSGNKADALRHHCEQGEGGAHLISLDQLGHDRAGDFLNRPVERKEEAGEEEVGEGGAKGNQDHGGGRQSEGQHDQGRVLQRDQCEKRYFFGRKKSPGRTQGGLEGG